MADSDIHWLGESRIGGAIQARIGSCGTTLIADWTGIGRLTVGRDGSNPLFDVRSGVTELQRSKIERGAVRLLLRSLEGKIGLHGAAVAIDREAVILLGNAAAGKSTLAAALCSQCESELLADDSVALEGPPSWSVVPTEEIHFLDRGAVGALNPDRTREGGLGRKIPILASRVGAEATPLAAMVRLVFDDSLDEPELTRLSLVDALAAAIPQSIRFALDDPNRQRTELDALSDLVTHVPVFVLTRARRFEQLAATTAVIRALLQTGRQGPP